MPEWFSRSVICICYPRLGHCRSVSEPQRRERPKKARAAEEGQLCSHSCSKRDGLHPALPCPRSSCMQHLAPAFPAFLTSVQSAPPRMTFSRSLTLPSQFPPQGLCTYSYCLSTYPPCAHICACVNTQTHTHITLSVPLAGPLPAGKCWHQLPACPEDTQPLPQS